MGEIKSTLDLVLEKTRNLTLTDEERRNLAREELDKKIGSLVNKYLDNLLPVGRLKEEMENLDTKDIELPSTLFLKHLLSHFDLDGDNSAILSALSGVAGFDVAPFIIHQQAYETEREEARKCFAKNALQAVKERGASGSAVVPNLAGIPEWVQHLKDLHKRYQEKLRPLVES